MRVRCRGTASLEVTSGPIQSECAIRFAVEIHAPAEAVCCRGPRSSRPFAAQRPSSSRPFGAVTKLQPSVARAEKKKAFEKLLARYLKAPDECIHATDALRVRCPCMIGASRLAERQPVALN